jgi:hypothetical protein
MSEADKRIAKHFKTDTLQCYDDLHEIYTGVIANGEFVVTSGLGISQSTISPLPDTPIFSVKTKSRSRTVSEEDSFASVDNPIEDLLEDDAASERETSSSLVC